MLFYIFGRSDEDRYWYPVTPFFTNVDYVDVLKAQGELTSAAVMLGRKDMRFKVCRAPSERQARQLLLAANDDQTVLGRVVC